MGKRHLALLLFAAGLVFQLFSSSYIPLSAQPLVNTWDYTYTDFRGVGRSVIQTQDGGYAVAGTADGHFLLAKVNAVGELQWSKTFGEGIANCVYQTSDGSYILVGNSSVFNVVKTDTDGNVIWQKSYDDTPASIELSSVIQTVDGGYALIGNNINETGIMIKTDVEGDVQWNRTYDTDFPHIHLTLINDIIQINDGGYMIAAKGRIVRLDVNGDRLWYRDTPGMPNFILPINNDGYFLSGNRHVEIPISPPPDETEFYPTGFPGQASILVETDREGNWKWSKTIVDGNYSIFTAGAKTSEDGYVVAGILSAQLSMQKTGNITIPSLADHFSVGIVKVDGDGNVIGNITYPPAIQGNKRIDSIIEDSHGYYVFTGAQPDENGVEHVWLVKTQVTPTPDTTPPTIRVLSPRNLTYNDSAYLTFYVSEPTSWIGYSLNDQSNITVATNTTLTNLPQGTHTLIVHANDTTGNFGTSNIVHFTSQPPGEAEQTPLTQAPSAHTSPAASTDLIVENSSKPQQPAPFSTTLLIGVTLTIAIFAAITITVYFKKVKQHE